MFQRLKLIVLVLLLASCLAPALARPHHHGGDSEGDRVVIGDDLVIAPNAQQRGDVVVIGGNLKVGEGASLGGDAVVIAGSIELAPGSRVENDAVALLGGIDLQAGARVDNDAVSILGSGIRLAPGAAVGKDTVSLLSGRWMVGLLFLGLCILPLHLAAWLPDLCFGLLLLLLARGFVRRVSAVVSSSPGHCLLWGLLGVGSSGLIFALLGITIIGLLLWPVLGSFYAVAGAAGLVACGSALGEWLEMKGLLSPGSFPRRCLVGTAGVVLGMVALRSLPWLGLPIGGVVLSVIRTLGVGACVMMLFKRTPPGVLD